MIKKSITLISVVLVMLVISACSSSPEFEDASTHAQAVGRAAIEIADEYLDLRITASEAEQRIRDLGSANSGGPGIDGRVDYYVARVQTGLGSISSQEFRGNPIGEYFDELLDRRNQLAEGFGISRR